MYKVKFSNEEMNNIRSIMGGKDAFYDKLLKLAKEYDQEPIKDRWNREFLIPAMDYLLMINSNKYTKEEAEVHKTVYIDILINEKEYEYLIQEDFKFRRSINAFGIYWEMEYEEGWIDVQDHTNKVERIYKERMKNE